MPALAELALDELVRAARYPGTKVLSSFHSVGSLLVLKASRRGRAANAFPLGADGGLGLALGLVALPKVTHLTSYSYRVRRSSNIALLEGLSRRCRQIGLYTGDGGFNLDFHTIRHHASEVPLEEHYVVSRSQRTRSVLIFFAQDHASTEMVYANADITKAEQAKEVIAFADYWSRVAGADPGLLDFDSKLTTYPILDELCARHITFLTLRQRGPKVFEALEALAALPPLAWTSYTVKRSGRYRHPQIHEQVVNLKSISHPLRQIAIRKPSEQTNKRRTSWASCSVTLADSPQPGLVAVGSTAARSKRMFATTAQAHRGAGPNEVSVRVRRDRDWDLGRKVRTPVALFLARQHDPQSVDARRDRRSDAAVAPEGGEGNVDVLRLADGEIDAEPSSLRSADDAHHMRRTRDDQNTLQRIADVHREAIRAVVRDCERGLAPTSLLDRRCRHRQRQRQTGRGRVRSGDVGALPRQRLVAAAGRHERHIADADANGVTPTVDELLSKRFLSRRKAEGHHLHRLTEPAGELDEVLRMSLRVGDDLSRDRLDLITRVFSCDDLQPVAMLHESLQFCSMGGEIAAHPHLDLHGFVGSDLEAGEVGGRAGRRSNGLHVAVQRHLVVISEARLIVDESR